MINEILLNIGVMAAITIVSSEYLSRLTKVDGTWAQVQSWIISVGIAMLAGYLGIGIFPLVSWVSTGLYGLLIGLVANGVFNIPITKTVLSWIKARV